MYLVCCQPGAMNALGNGAIGGATDVRNLDAKNLPPATSGDIVVLVTPVSWLYLFFFRLFLYADDVVWVWAHHSEFFSVR